MLAEALDECPMRILAFVLMPNHWHFVLWPERDAGQVGALHPPPVNFTPLQPIALTDCLLSGALSK